MFSHRLPELPTIPGPARLLSIPIRLIPDTVHAHGLAFVLNRILVDALDQKELDFLDDQVAQITVSDLGLDYRLTLRDGRLSAADTHRQPDVRFGGFLKEFMLLALNKEDPDTLFFQRRLQLEGDTELGLEIKNFLYTLDENLLPHPIRQAAERIIVLLDSASRRPV